MSGVEALSIGRAWARVARGGRLEDPALPALAVLKDTAAAAKWWEARLGGRGVPRGELLEEVEILRYRPGRRCTLRLRFGGPERPRVYVKIHRPGRSGRIASVLRSLRSLGPWPDLRLPGVLSFVPEEGVIVLEDLAGASLEERLASSAAAEFEGEAVRALVRFHSLALPRVRPWTATDELGVLARHREPLLRRPDLAPERVESLYGRVADGAPALDASIPVLLHRDLHPQQILLDGERGGLVDLDGVARGPAEIDLGNLLAHLDLLAIHLSAAARLEEAARRIGAFYGSLRPLRPAALRVARAAALLRLAGLYAGTAGLEDLSPRLLARAERVLSAESPS